MFFRHINIKRCLLAALAGIALLATGQVVNDTAPEPKNLLTVDLQIMGRGESRYGGLLTEEPDIEEEEQAVENGKVPTSNFLLSRTRLPINFKRDWLEARLTPQHSGVWGQAGKGSFNLHESWAKLTTRFGLFAQVGRVALSYDDDRIIGTDDWAMASSSHDILRLGYEGKGHKAHIILAYNQNAEVMTNGGTYYVNGAQPYKTMHVAWYHYDLPRLPLGASLLFMNIGLQNDKDLLDEKEKTWFQQLLGGYLSFHPKCWNFEASYYKQMGKHEAGLKIDAWMASGKVSFTPKSNYGFVAGYDYLSGDEYFAVPPNGSIGMIRHEVIKGFNTVYGSHHKFYGAMDFFYVSTYLNGFTPGLQNIYAGAFFSPLKGLRIDGSYHYFSTATKLTGLDMFLGHEFELQAAYAITRDVRLMAGFSYMTGGETMERLKRDTGNSSLRWGWIGLSVNPNIFSTKW